MSEDKLNELLETLKDFIRDEIRKALKEPVVDIKKLMERGNCGV